MGETSRLQNFDSLFILFFNIFHFRNRATKKYLLYTSTKYFALLYNARVKSLISLEIVYALHVLILLYILILLGIILSKSE